MNYRLIFLLVISAINIFWGIDSPLLDPDEPAYAQTAKEMLLANDFLSPKIFGNFWFDKPPMYYWLVIFSYKIFGVSEFAARLPAGIFALSLVFSVYYFVSRILSDNIAFMSSLVLATCVNFFYLAKASVTDMVLVFFLTTTLLAFLDKKYYLMYLCMGLATLTKGPVGILFPGAIIFLYLLFTNSWYILKRIKILSGILIIALVTTPWYYLMYQAHGQAFIDTFLGLHNIARFTNPEHTNRVLWYYYIPVLIVGLFPWINFFVSSVYNSLRTSPYKDRHILIFFNIWWMFIFLFFSVAKTKLVSYIFPLFPAVSILIAWYIEQLSAQYQVRNRFSFILTTIISWFPFTVVWAVAALFLPKLAAEGKAFLLPAQVSALVLYSWIIFAVIVLSMLIVCYSYHKGKLHITFFTQIALGVAIMFLVINVALPVLRPNLSVKATAAVYMEKYNTTQNLYVDKFLRPGFAFYTNLYGKEVVDQKNKAFDTDSKDGHMLPELLQDDSAKGNVVMRRLMYNRLTEQQKNRLQLLHDNNELLIFKLK